MIWNKSIDLERLNASAANTMVEAMQIRYTGFDDNSLYARMPVTDAVRQPMGLLHGGASAALAETLGSAAAYLAAPKGSMILGTEITANHLRGVLDGEVEAIATPTHLGRQLQLWGVEIFQGDGEERKLICSARLSVMVKPKTS